MATSTKIANITKKFYKTENERLEKIEENKVFIQFFMTKLNKVIMELYNKGLKFHVFHFKENTIHVGLFNCCDDKDSVINPNYRILIDDNLKNIGFTNIIWEDLYE